MDDVRCASRCHVRALERPIGRHRNPPLRHHGASTSTSVTAPRRRTLREVTPPTDFRGQRTMGEHATTTTTNEKTDKANASTSVLKQKYQALLESRNKVRRRRRDDAFERAWSCLFTQPMRFNPPCGCEWCTDLEKSRIARHDSTKKKPKNCAGR